MTTYVKHFIKYIPRRWYSLGYFNRVIQPIDQEFIPEKSSKALSSYKEVVAKYQEVLKAALEGGGPKSIERHVQKNKKVLVRERIKKILDPNSPFIEIGQIAGFDMIYGDIPAGGIVSGIGRIRGVYCIITGNDATVKGGTYFPITVVKSKRIQDVAEMNRFPTIYIPDSGGAFLPMQAEIFPDKKHGGRGFYNQAIMSSKGIHQIAIVSGSCTAGGAYNPTMSDEAIIVDKIGKIYLGGPPLVKAATGEIVSDEELGGATLHSFVSGCTDYFAKDELDAFESVKDIVESLNMTQVPASPTFKEPVHKINNWDDIGSRAHIEKGEMYNILASILDNSSFKEFKTYFGTGLIVGNGYIKGQLVGILANVNEILSEEALKGSHFMDMCNRRKIPLVFLQNSVPFENRMDRNEIDSAVLKDRAKMSSRLATVDVPKISITLTSCSDDDHLLMCGPSFSPNFHFTWPMAKLSNFIMDGDCSQTEDRIVDSFFAAYNLITDGVILPNQTRDFLGEILVVLKQARLNPEIETKSPVLRM